MNDIVGICRLILLIIFEDFTEKLTCIGLPFYIMIIISDQT
jgi:hypothetical protein